MGAVCLFCYRHVAAACYNGVVGHVHVDHRKPMCNEPRITGRVRETTRLMLCAVVGGPQTGPVPPHSGLRKPVVQRLHCRVCSCLAMTAPSPQC